MIFNINSTRGHTGSLLVIYKIGRCSKIQTFIITTRAEQMRYTKTDVVMYLRKSPLQWVMQVQSCGIHFLRNCDNFLLK